MTGIEIGGTGERFACRTDVGNGYVRDARDAAWRPLFSPSTMRAEDYDPLPALNGKADGEGVAGIRIAPSNPDVIYASYHGLIWKSADGGRSVRRTALPQVAMPANTGLQRLYNRTIDVDPRNPDHLIVGSFGEGVWWSLDGGLTWTRADLPASRQSIDRQPGVNLVLFDPEVAGKVYVFVTGVGLFLSGQGPAGPFVRVTGGPAQCSHLVAAGGGSILLCGLDQNDGERVWRLSSAGAWSATRLERPASVVAVDPRRKDRLVASDADGYMMQSFDGGRTFASLGVGRWQANGEIAWMSNLGSMFPAEIKFDPVRPGRLWAAQGVGVATIDLAGDRPAITDWSAGIEELCAVASLSVPGGKTFLTAWDKPFWRLDDLTSYSNDFRYPVPAGKRHDANLVAYASFLDFAGDDPRFLVGVVAPSEKSAPGFSPDGGDNWQTFETEPASGWGYGGCIAASTRKNFVLLPSNNGTGVYTLDGGRSWSPIRLDGKAPTSGFANAYYVTRKNVTADKTRPGTFALIYTVIRNNEFGEPLGGVWLTRDGGASWRQMLRGVVNSDDHDPRNSSKDEQDNRQFWQCQLEYVPGRSGELLYTPHADRTGDRLWWSRDDGKTWQEAHSAVRAVTAFGFGKNSAGSDRPAVYFWGSVDGIEGLHATFDWFKTAPVLLTRHPSQMLAPVVAVGGDVNQPGRAYVGTSCAGWIQVDVV